MLEGSQPWGKGCVGEGKARDDRAKLCTADRAGLLPAPEPGSVVSQLCFVRKNVHHQNQLNAAWQLRQN